MSTTPTKFLPLPAEDLKKFCNKLVKLVEFLRGANGELETALEETNDELCAIVTAPVGCEIVYSKTAKLLYPYKDLIMKREPFFLSADVQKKNKMPDMLVQMAPLWSTMDNDIKNRIWTDLQTVVGMIRTNIDGPSTAADEESKKKNPIATMKVVQKLLHKVGEHVKKQQQQSKTEENEKGSSEKNEAGIKDNIKDNKEFDSNEQEVLSYLFGKVDLGKEDTEKQPQVMSIVRSFVRDLLEDETAESKAEDESKAEAEDGNEDAETDETEEANTMQADDDPKRQEVKEKVSKILLLDQAHYGLLRIEEQITGHRHEEFPILLEKHRAFKRFLKAVKENGQGSKDERNTVVVKEVAKFYKEFGKRMQAKDATVFTEPTHPFLREVDSAKIWNSFNDNSHQLIWGWVNDLQNIILAANVCVGPLQDFEVMAKDILPELYKEINQLKEDQTRECSDEERREQIERSIRKFMSVLKNKRRKKMLRQLIRTFSSQGEQVDDAMTLVDTIMDSQFAGEEEETA